MRSLLVFTLGVIVSTAGCDVRVVDIPDERPYVAVVFTYLDMADASPTPPVPSSGCVDGCGCNGTGEERSGDGLAVVGCRCPETCECKANKSAPEPATEPEPPLVKIEPTEPTVYRMPGSRWTFEGMGTNPPAAMKARHLAEVHGLDTTGMTSEQMSDLHDNAHNYGDSKAYGLPNLEVTRQPTTSSSCPGGNCPTPSNSGTVIRRGIFGRRR